MTAPGTGWPTGSRTVPRITPVVAPAWAPACGEATSSIINAEAAIAKPRHGVRGASSKMVLFFRIAAISMTFV